MEARQIWNDAVVTATETMTRAHCTPFTLPSNGILSIAPSSVITLTTDAIFKPECTGLPDIVVTSSTAPSSLDDFRDPFYASTIPECYALAATTVISYMLVIVLLITPRTFLHEGAVVLGRRGFTNGPSGSDAGIGIGGRPWLQKVAALTVAISLTIATADTFRVAGQQYNLGFQNALALQNEVEDGLELKIIRVISDTFLWLAQAQTLIRLFPRQREKIIIKWTAFALISLDVLFGTLNNFVYDGNTRPRSFTDAIPALSYLFQLALSLLYSAWVIYYVITKRRYAFYHSQMRNICLVALLSLLSILVPVVFFVLDISKPTLAGWGDYVRWVGAAAASVVVWEWVERIEALERNDKKDGVLGREIFDGDEMLEVTPSSEFTWTQPRQNRKDELAGGGGGGTTTGANGISWPAMTGLANRYRPRAGQDVEAGANRVHRFPQDAFSRQRTARSRPPLWPTRPPAVATPISRTDSASAESTVYAIRYHPINEPTPSIMVENARPPAPSRSNSVDGMSSVNEDINGADKPIVIEQTTDVAQDTSTGEQRRRPWRTLAKANPFRRRIEEPPPEVSEIISKSQQSVSGYGTSHRWDVRARFQDFAATQADKLREKSRPSVHVEPLPVTVIPAPTRRRNLATELEELEDAQRDRQRSLNPVDVPTSTVTVARTQTPDESSRRPRRPSNPYPSNGLNIESISHHGSISSGTAIPPDSNRRPGESSPLLPLNPISPTDDQHGTNTIADLFNSTARSRSHASSRRDGSPRRNRDEE